MTIKWKKDSSYIELVADLLDLAEVQSLEDFTHHLYTNRLAHSMSVSYRSYCWAKRFKLNVQSTARAALLHDLFFYYPADYQKIPNGKGHLHDHPQIALLNAKQLIELSDLEEDIILKHMFGLGWTIPKYPESWIVSLIDKECAILEVCGAMVQKVYHFMKPRFSSIS